MTFNSEEVIDYPMTYTFWSINLNFIPFSKFEKRPPFGVWPKNTETVTFSISMT